MVVAQLVQRLLPTPESHPELASSQIFIERLPVSCIEKMKIKQKEADNGTLKKLKETKCESSLFYFFHG